jgi:acyl carrier protein
MTPEVVIDWLNEEGMVELGDDFSADGDLFAAGLDSMAVMQLVVAAEEKFGVILGAEDITRGNLATPRTMAELLSAKAKSS